VPVRTPERIRTPVQLRAPELVRTPEMLRTPELARAPEQVGTPELARIRSWGEFQRCLSGCERDNQVRKSTDSWNSREL
jgi:hypothetical protein